jgi:HK97 family phage prohead protease
MNDVIFNYNHEGKVLARTRNKTLELNIDEKGLKIRARLDGTDEGRKLYEEIKGGYVDRMSFAFRTQEESFDKENNQWNIRKIKRLYDVSAVSIPAYDDTSISARKSFILEAEAQEKARLAAEAALVERRNNLINRLKGEK